MKILAGFSKVFIGHDARIAPSSTLENPAKIFFVIKSFKSKHTLSGASCLMHVYVAFD